MEQLTNVVFTTPLQNHQQQHSSSLIQLYTLNVIIGCIHGGCKLPSDMLMRITDVLLDYIPDEQEVINVMNETSLVDDNHMGEEDDLSTTASYKEQPLLSHDDKKSTFALKLDITKVSHITNIIMCQIS
jgi:hypothetical protein